MAVRRVKLGPPGVTERVGIRGLPAKGRSHNYPAFLEQAELPAPGLSSLEFLESHRFCPSVAGSLGVSEEDEPKNQEERVGQGCSQIQNPGKARQMSMSEHGQSN